MSWKDDKNLGPWDFEKSGADDRYNEGDLIATSADPVWSMEHTGVPISTTHMPCGYWINKYVDLYDYLTSMPYPVEVSEGVNSEGASIPEVKFYQANRKVEESVDSSGSSITAGTFVTIISHYYEDWPIEGVDSSGSDIIAGTFVTLVSHYYEDWPVESVDSSGSTITAGTLADVVIRYEDWPLESVNSSGSTIISGTFSTP